MSVKPKGSNKLHLVECPEPLSDYADLEAECGYQFRDAEHKWSFDGDSRPHPNWWETLNALAMCRECFNIVKNRADKDKGRYLYALAEASPKGEAA